MTDNGKNDRIIKRDVFKTDFDNRDEGKFHVSKDERIISNTPKQAPEPPKPPFYQKFLTKQFGIGAVCAVVVLCVASFFMFSGKPKPVVEDYIKAVAAADFGKAYQYLDVKQHPTLSTPAYLKFVEYARNSQEDNLYKLAQNEIKSVELAEGKEQQNGLLSLEASIVVGKNGKDENHKLTVFVEKKKTGPFALFTNYKIAGNGIYAIPKVNCLTGTEQMSIDGVKLAGEKEKLNLNKPVFYGWHDVECKGKFYDSFKDRVLFDQETGMLQLNVKKFKLNSACRDAILGASKEFAAQFFPATLVGNGYKQCKTVPNEKSIDEMYKQFSEGFKQVGVSSIKITDGKLLSFFAAGNGNLQCQYEYIGSYEQNGQASKECNGVINMEYISDNGHLIVAKINDYNIHLKD